MKTSRMTAALVMVIGLATAATSTRATVIGYDMESLVGGPAGFANVLNNNPLFDRGVLDGVTQSSAQVRHGTYSAYIPTVASTNRLVPSNTNITPATKLTVAANIFLEPTGSSGARTIMGKLIGPVFAQTGHFYFSVGDGVFPANHGKLTFAVRFPGGPTITLVQDTIVLSTNTWYHVAATFDQGVVKLYLDGTLVKTQDISGGYGTTLTGTGSGNLSTIGNVASSSNALGGYMDDFYYNDGVALDGDGIAKLANNAVSSIPEPSCAGLMAAGLLLLRRRRSLR